MRIAKDSNATDPSQGVGYLTQFQVKSGLLSRYQVPTVGGRIHQEYWIPAGDLAESNPNIVGRIEVIAEFHSKTKNASEN